MPDGTIFAGISPDTNRPLYTVPADAGLTINFSKAAEYALDISLQNAHGCNDWRVPSDAELNVLYQNKDKGALKNSFKEAAGGQEVWYRSSTRNQDLNNFTHAQRFDDGSRVWIAHGKRAYLRCVRS
jgi:hypothetical protein